MHAPRSVRPNSDRLRDIEPTDDGNLHWSLAIVCIAPQPGPQPPHPQVDLAALFGAEVAASIKKKQKQAELPRKIDMLYFDSMGCDGQVHCKSIIEYLNYKWNKEHTELKEGENPPTDWPYKQRLVRLGSAAAHSESFDAADDVVWVNMVEKKAPIQKNDHDCGMFLLEYAERFAKEIMFLEEAEGGDCEEYIRRTAFQQWFHNETVQYKRKYMQDLLKYLERDAINALHPKPKAKVWMSLMNQVDQCDFMFVYVIFNGKCRICPLFFGIL